MGDGSGPRITALLLLLVLATGPIYGAAAGAAEPVRLDLEQCLQRALRYSPDLIEGEWDIRLAESHVAEADAGRYPTANVTSITGVVPSVKGQVYDPPIDTVSSNTGDLGPFTRVELEFVQPLFTWGKISAGRTAAAKGLEQEVAKQHKRRDEVVLDVKRMYYELLLSRQIAELLGEVVDNFDKAIDTAEERLESDQGTVTQADVLKLKIGRSGITREVFKAKNGAELAREGLGRAIGLPADSDFDVTDTRLEPVAAQLKDLDEYVDSVFERSPEWKQILAGIAAREAQVEIEESDYYPTLFIAGGFRYGYAPDRDRQLSPFAKDDFNYLDLPGATLGIHWPLSFLQTHARVQAAKAELAKLQAQKASAATGIRLAVKKAYLDAVQQHQGLDEADKGRKAARGLLVTSVSGFELGVGDAKDVFEALVVYTQSTSSFYEAISDYNVAVAELSQTVGEEVTGLSY